MDRLSSQLLEVSAPPPMAAMHKELGTKPADPEAFEAIADQMSEPDGEG